MPWGSVFQDMRPLRTLESCDQDRKKDTLSAILKSFFACCLLGRADMARRYNDLRQASLTRLCSATPFPKRRIWFSRSSIVKRYYGVNGDNRVAEENAASGRSNVAPARRVTENAKPVSSPYAIHISASYVR